MSNPSLYFDDDHYPDVKRDRIDSSMSESVDYLQGCNWMCGDIADICSTHTGGHVFCTTCGHEVDCHVTVRVTL